MNLQNLLESASPYKSLQNDASRLASKWNKTGLLEGLKGEIEKNNMAMILENQAKQLVNETSLSGAGTAGATFTAGVGEQWAGVALPLVRKVFGQIASKEFVSVQPMNLPSGLVFYLDFQYGTTKNPFTAGQSMYGNSGSASYPFGNTNTGGAYGAGRFGYSINNTSSAAAVTSTGSATWATFNFDDNFSASFGQYKTVTVTLPAGTDFNAVRAFTLTSASAMTEANNLPAFTTTTGNPYGSSSSTVTFVMTGSLVLLLNSVMTSSFSLQPADNKRGDFEDGNTTLNANNNPISIPEINVQLRSEAIVAKTRKLKAVWTPEFSQDLNAYHSLDAEAELTSVMSEYISLEIDLEILDMLIDSAGAGIEYWSAQNNQVINTAGTAFVAAPSAFYNTQGGWFATLGTKIQKLSNVIHQRTLRGGANFMVVAPQVATVLESIPGYAADTNGDVTKMNYNFGVMKAGSINSHLKVYKNPYMTENTILLGFRGSQFLETGAVFAPYVPLIMTPLIYDPNTFTPRKGLLTRYAKKMLRPEFYGLIYVSGLSSI
jgi:hypothetical protein